MRAKTQQRLDAEELGPCFMGGETAKVDPTNGQACKLSLAVAPRC